MASIKVYPYYSPRIVEVLTPETEITIQELVDLIRDWEDSEEGMPFDYIISAAGKEDLGGGVTVGITATLNNAQIMFTGRTIPIDDGVGRTCDATDALGLQLYVDDADFISDGVVRGDTIYNATTGEMATILEVVDQYTLNHLELTGFGENGWTLGDNYVVYHNAQCSISGGNLVAVDDVGSSISSILQSPNTQVVRTSSSSATLQELEAIQFSSFGGGVTVDVANVTGQAVSGVNFPAGTRQNPVNNMADANSIADERGLSTFFIIGDITLNDPTVNLHNHIFIGESPNKTTITIDSSADVYRCEFREATIEGVLDGDSIIRNGVVGNINYFSGIIFESMFTATITLGNGAAAHMLDCYSGVPGQGTPIIDMGGSGQALALRDYVGGIQITNKTGEEAVSIDMASGQIKFTDTVTNGNILCRGVGQITQDLSRGAVIFDAMIDMSGMTKPPGGIPRINIVN